MMHLAPNGCWAEFRATRTDMARPCLFLDRDGVVILDRHHLADPAGVELIAPTIRAMAWARAQGWLMGLVTNQSGIGRGYFGWQDFAAVQARLDELLAAEGLALDFICACPYQQDARPPYGHPDHPWRKPNPGMLLHATDMLGIDPARSAMVGDRQSDIEAGRGAGVSLLVFRDAEGRFARIGADAPPSQELAPLLPSRPA